ncbi:Asp-tRNA(Asn)/Glu-tRNA(Gln) amidotransferase subunit GatC [Candidatus Woesearchaeota archaeon]|nr:Asp-tRNA(Asn)/Glu-tRNA(Gln) amidotransferase subunit GatC [Candidatus Woesearchaeota archaeon]
MKGVKVDKELILKVAQNARLELSEAEIEEFLPQLNEVLEFFSHIDLVDTKGIEPSMQPVELRNVLREDVVKPSLSQEDALKNTEHKKDSYFKGPRAV